MTSCFASRTLHFCRKAGPWLLFGAACIPVVTWHGRRMTDRSAEPLGLAALALALWFGWAHRQDMVFRAAVMTLLSLSLLALAWWGIPPLLLGLLAVTSLTVSCRPWPGRSGLMALLILSLPLMASLDFYAGYPMRFAAASLTHGILSACGLAVERSGVLLLEAGQIVGVIRFVPECGCFGQVCWQPPSWPRNRRPVAPARLPFWSILSPW